MEDAMSRRLLVVLLASVVLGALPHPARGLTEESLAKLTASDSFPNDSVGQSAAISGDTIVVGTPSGLHGNLVPGVAYVFVKPQNGWSGRLQEAARLIPSDGGNFDSFGVSAATGGDTVVIGAYEHDSGGAEDQGAAYVFVKPPGGWSGQLTETAKLVASDGDVLDRLGTGVAIVGDTIVVGAPGDDIGGNLQQGSIYVFVKPQGGWSGTLTETAKLTASEPIAGDGLGGTVAMSGDTIVASAGASLPQGGAYVFVEPPGGWAGEVNEAAKLTPSDWIAFDDFGSDVAINGETIVIGARFADVDQVDQGSAYVFVEPPGGWAGELTESAKLTASDGATLDLFGDAVAVSGPVIVVGALNDDVGPVRDQGSTSVFLEPPGGWSGHLNETFKLTAPDAEPVDACGWSAAIETGVVVAGCPLDGHGRHENQGSAYVFSEVGEVERQKR
jgi:hypothetical protein